MQGTIKSNKECNSNEETLELSMEEKTQLKEGEKGEAYIGNLSYCFFNVMAISKHQLAKY